jgi:hypothetical protein
MNARGYTPLRCRRCSHRFYRKLFPGDALGIPDPAVPVDAPRPDAGLGAADSPEGAD